MASAGKIETFHRQLESCLGVLSIGDVSVQTSSDGWKRAARGTRISFDAICRDYTTTAERKRGGRCPVFALRGDPASLEDQAWAAWHEEWYCLERETFDLIGVGWTFFWGVGGRLGPESEILRAEWDEVPRTQKDRHRRGGFAAQPHWHLDTPMMTGFTRPVIREAVRDEATELEEIPSGGESALEEEEIGEPAGIQELDLSGMHLGMGGWTNHTEHPQWWQMQISENWSELVRWAARTLQCATDQFAELKIADIPM